MDKNNFSISQELGIVLAKHRLTLAVAESCTGGGLAFQLTAVPDCSVWFERGFVTYTNLSKVELLSVNPATLEKHGAVSAEVAAEMAKGAIKHSHADYSLSITGIAGPGGGTAQKPVGMVYFGLADRQGGCQTRLAHFASGRKQIRVDAVGYAIRWLLNEGNFFSLMERVNE